MPCLVNVTQATFSGFAGDCVPGTRHYGTLGRNSLVGPTYKQWDLSIYKNTAITERVSVQLRADFFNILNHPNFANPVLPAFIADPSANIQACGTWTMRFSRQRQSRSRQRRLSDYGHR